MNREEHEHVEVFCSLDSTTAAPLRQHTNGINRADAYDVHLCARDGRLHPPQGESKDFRFAPHISRSVAVLPGYRWSSISSRPLTSTVP